MPAYTITAVGDTPREWKNQQGGTMLDYRMSVKDPQGVELTNVEWTRKPGSPAPKVGESIEGEIETKTIDTRNGPMQKRKFKLAGGGFGGGGPRQRDPKETAAIQRQHSQSVAVEYLIFRAQAEEQIPREWLTREGLRDLIDWFQEDIEYGVRLSQQPSYGKPRKVKDTVQTGASDVPGPAPGEFVHEPEPEGQFS